jgi:hypothetical protein
MTNRLQKFIQLLQFVLCTVFAKADNRTRKNTGRKEGRKKEKGRERKERGKGGKGMHTSEQTQYNSNTMAKVASIYICNRLWCW